VCGIVLLVRFVVFADGKLDSGVLGDYVECRTKLFLRSLILTGDAEIEVFREPP